MKKVVLAFQLLFIIIAAGCRNIETSSAAVAAENYLYALAEKDKARVVALSCKEWEESATLEVDALLSVEAKVVDLSCEVTAENVDDSQVICSGSLDLTYNDEIRTIDLSRRTYFLRKEDGQWRVCSYK